MAYRPLVDVCGLIKSGWPEVLKTPPTTLTIPQPPRERGHVVAEIQPTAAFKLCNRCGETKPLTEFHSRILRGKRWHRGTCRTCRTEIHRLWMASTSGRDSLFRRRAKQAKNLTSAATNDLRKRRPPTVIPRIDYDAEFAAQNGVCAICGRPERRLSRLGKVVALSIDHDHNTGKYRGLLCTGCNYGLGCFGDNPDRLRTALRYLERHQDVPQKHPTDLSESA